jgi:ATP-dependent helicase/nuclease subunit A
MTTWTKNQEEAINTSGCNIIVSAGAGSGKTAVLTERVINKLRNGININELLILTFTKNAAHEMKERIRAELIKDKSLKEQLDYIDISYITTFDSYSMALVSKYSYVLGISSNINIIDSNICKNLTIKYLDEIFEEQFNLKDDNFIKLVQDLTFKSDKSLKENIIQINTSLNKLINKEEYLKNYIKNYYNEKNIENLKNNFIELIKNKINKIKKEYEDISYICDEKYYNVLTQALDKLLSSNTYNEILINSNINLPRLPINSSDELKEAKEKLKKEIEELKKYLLYSSEEEIILSLNSNKNYVEAIINILLKLNEKLINFKYINNVFEFNDIALMAIKIIKENNNIKEEIKNSFKEIMLDEYQDTSDIQEELIKLISNNNVYMVGDIKQSIYRFRNANPIIFKEKYDNYSKNIGGIKIDLLKNFRSREEVLIGINNIFNNLMTNNLGGANYKESHQMKYGNDAYNKKEENQNYELEILNYLNNDKKYSSNEYEAFLIANDIIKKINNNTKVLDKKTKDLRNINYNDFCILIDRGKEFNLYKKIFEYFKIPLNIINDEKITEDNDLLVIKNIIDLIIKIYKKEYNYKIKYDLYSIYRSFLTDYNDNDYFNNVIVNDYFNDEIFIKCKKISEQLEFINNKELLEIILNEFDYYNNLIKIGNIKSNIVKIDYLLEIAENLSNIGYSVIDFSDYFNDMIDNKLDIKYSFEQGNSNSVKLMNIHKSKGLEFSYCYYAGLNNLFNINELKEDILFDKDYGFITPFYDKDKGIREICTKFLYKKKYIEEDISERIRLFYVALTRAKEKIIILTEDIFNYKLSNYNSFKSFIYKVISNINNNVIETKVDNISKEYKNNKNIDFIINKKNDKLVVDELDLDNNVLYNEHASYININLIDKEEHNLLNVGTKIHNLLEYNDFDIDNKYINNIKNKIPNIVNATIYKEFKFYEVINDKTYTGIIDLMLEYENEINIIDYKLKNIDKKEYINQLEIYKNVIKNRTNKIVRTFLYSILEDNLKEVNI